MWHVTRATRLTTETSLFNWTVVLFLTTLPKEFFFVILSVYSRYAVECQLESILYSETAHGVACYITSTHRPHVYRPGPVCITSGYRPIQGVVKLSWSMQNTHVLLIRVK